MEQDRGCGRSRQMRLGMDPGDGDTGGRTTNLYKGWVGRMKRYAPRDGRLGRVKKHPLKQLWFDDGGEASRAEMTLWGRSQGTRTSNRTELVG